MSSNAINTLVKMMESLPEPMQDDAVNYMREYIMDLQDELKWNKQFKGTQKQLVAAARRAKKEIAKGSAEPMDYDKL